MKGKQYYYEHRYTGKELENGRLEYTEIVYDSCNRKTKYTLDDFKNNKDYFISSYNGVFSRIINMRIIKKCIFHPCPWKDTYKDQALLCYIDEEKYNEDLKKPKIERYGDEFSIFGNDVFDFLEDFKRINEELSNELSLIVELTKDDGIF